MYVVSPRHPQGLRYNRKVYGFGLWSQTGARIDLYEDGEILARRRVFYFDLGPNIRWGRIRTSWRMIEICLHPNPNNNCTEYLAFYILRYVHPPVQAAPDLGPAGPHMGPLNLGYGGGGDMPQSSSGTEEDVAEDGEDEGVENNGHESPNDVFENEHEIRDTSVLVRLRPAWEDLRSYLIAKGRKRFEVYVCTMAERDYALEMWRLLDPGSHLIGSKQLLNRVNCVKPGARKSLLSVFQDRNCHPRMAMVIDDRLMVWEEKDQPRVHVVPAFTPYYAPQAETANAVPVLCVARNVACNVRGGFFKDFDEILLRRLAEHFYEDEVSNLPYVPDVCNYLVSEDASFVPNGNTNAPMTEGITGPAVAPRLSQQDNKSVDPKSERSLPSVLTASIYGPSSFRSVVLSEKPSILGPIQGPEMSNKQRAGYNPPSHGTASSFSSGAQPPVSEARGDEAVHGYGLQKKNLPQAGQLSGIQGTINRLFVYEVMFTGKKIGTGMGKTRKDAQQPATENPFCSLADKYAAYVISRSETGNKEPDNQSSDMENGFLWDSDSDESLVKDVDKSSEVEEFSTQVASPVLKNGKEIEASDEYIKVQLADPVHYWTLVEFDLVHDWTPVESKNSFLNYWEKEVNILPGDLKHGAGTIGKIGIEHDKNHFSIDDCSFEAITEPFKVKDLRNELTMLGYCPVSVLPSNTAIAPVNPTFSHRENYKDTYKPSLQDLILTTENFAHVNCIGKGGFGRVYKGEHANVRGNRSRGKGDTEFYSELQILSKYKHENAMSLVGYITETDEKFIVYEHASRESLDKYLNDVSPTWNNRLKICINFATRLDFLHGRLYWRKTIIHRYIKAANIIPPGDLKAKIGTLGLSMESTINQEKDYATDHVCGTRGYVDLMYFKSDYLTRESDVILFDILCGRSMYAIYHEKGQYLPSKRNWTEMTLLSFVDRDGDQEGKDRDRGRERNDRERDSNCYAKPVKNIAESAARKLWVEIMLGEGGLKKVDYLNFSKTNRTEMR